MPSLHQFRPFSFSKYIQTFDQDVCSRPSGVSGSCCQVSSLLQPGQEGWAGIINMFVAALVNLIRGMWDGTAIPEFSSRQFNNYAMAVSLIFPCQLASTVVF
jgi:hypothetical protein